MLALDFGCSQFGAEVRSLNGDNMNENDIGRTVLSQSEKSEYMFMFGHENYTISKFFNHNKMSPD